MKKVVLLLFAACGLSTMADLVSLRADRKTLMCPDEQTLADVLSKESNRNVLILGDGGYLLNVSSLADNRSVGSLEIQNCEVSDLHGLAALKGLNSLILRNVRISGTDVFPAMPMLSVFMVWDSDIQDAAFDWSFLRASNRLHWLTVNNTKTVVPLDLSFVRELGALSNIALGGMSVTNFEAVAALRCLEDLDIRDARGVRSLAGLEMCSKMKRMVVTRRAFPRGTIDALKASFARGEGRMAGFGHLIEVPPNGRKADGDKLWEICFDESLGTNRIIRLQKLLSSGCDPNDPTFSDKLVLTELVNCWQKFDETDCLMVELLLKHGADVRMGASLCKLCGQKYDRANGRLKVVELLLDKGLDPNEVDDSGNSILQIIADRGGDDAGDGDLVDLLLRRGADPKKCAVSLCELCGKFGLERTNRVAIVSALLKKGMDVNEVGKRGLSVLGTVIENSMIEKDERLALAKLLLEHGADVNAMIGFGSFRKTILDKVLSDHGSDEALQALFLPYAGDLKASRVSLHDLYESGAFNGETGIRKLESLLSKGCDPNERGFGGASLLMVVAEGKRRSDGTNDLAIAKVLLTHGADPNASTTFGETALGNVVKRSAFDGQLSFAQLLLDKGADPNAADHVGKTLLMRLFGRGFDESKLELMKLLLERGADVKGGERRQSVLDQVGNWQVGTQKLDVVRMLVGKGAPVTDGAICSAWRDEPLRHYLLEQSGKTEDDFEVWSSGSSFSVRTKRKNGHRADLERLHREMDERRIEREERHHHERMSHERMRRTVEEGISADRRQDEETRAERDLKVCQEHAERRRGEMLRGIPAENRQEFENWLASRRKEESAALESARNRARRREAEMKAQDEKSKFHQAEADGEMRRQEDEQLRRLRESGAPEHTIQHVEMQNRMREMHQRHQNEFDAMRLPRRFGFDQESALVRELDEYRRWLDGRVREDELRADGFRSPFRGAHAVRQAKHEQGLHEREILLARLREERHARLQDGPKERISIFGGIQQEKAVRGHYRGIGGLVVMMLDAMGISAGWVIVLVLTFVILLVVLFNLRIVRDWRCRIEKTDGVMEFGGVKDGVFTCEECGTRHRSEDAVSIRLHGNRRTVQVTKDKTISVETTVIAKVPVCTTCEKALYDRIGFFNRVCYAVFAGIFGVVAVAFYLFRFTIPSSVFLSIVVVILLGIAYLIVRQSWLARLGMDVDAYFMRVDELRKLKIALGFSVGKSNAEIQQPLEATSGVAANS